MINNNMQESLVFFPVAKLLKDAGFDGRNNCLNGFTNNGEESTDLEIDIINGNGIYRPTQQLVIDWLRENFNLHIYTGVDIVENKISFYYNIIQVDKFKLFKKQSPVLGLGIKHESFNFNTLEEAKEAALEYCLTNLILKK